MVFPGARLFRAPIWCPSRGGGTREAGSTVVESLVALSSLGTPQNRLSRKAARSSTSQGSAGSLCARITSANREVYREKLISEHGLLCSYESQQGAANRQDSWGFSEMHRASDGWMLARAPAPPAQGLHHHGLRYFNFPYICIMCGLEKLGPVDPK